MTEHCKEYCKDWAGEERREPHSCPVHMDFVQQVTKLSTVMEWFQTAGKWGLTILAGIVITAFGAHLNLAVKVENVQGQVYKTISLLQQHIEQEKHDGN